MTIQQEAYRLIDSMSESNVRILVDFINGLSVKTPDRPVPAVRHDENIRAANIRKIERISQLQEDWNGNGAKAIPGDVIDKVKLILESLDCQPEFFSNCLGIDSVRI